MWALFLFLPIGLVPSAYILSFFFQKELIAQTMIIFVNLVVGGIGSLVIILLRFFKNTYKIGDILSHVFKIFPIYCLTEGMAILSQFKIIKTIRNSEGSLLTPISEDIWAMENIGGDVLALCVHLVADLLLVLFFEGFFVTAMDRCVGRIRTRQVRRVEPEDVDSDVDRADKELEDSASRSYPVRVHQFRKVYYKLCGKPFPAVENVSFGMPEGECFALLGVNGAGKSTTFKGLTGEIQPTQGEILIKGMDITREFGKIRKQIGYCPQFDAIFELMSVEEHLKYYAMIKGIKPEKRTALINEKIDELNLTEYRNNPAGSLSGGNKRKLSVAIALLGNPPIILLDEPSAGMDPEARRFMWSVVSRISQLRKQSTVILTTHSMEEAEALSSKMGIMVTGGRFKCFGSAQHIKNKFGTGFEIEIKIAKISDEKIDEFKRKYNLDENVNLNNAIDILNDKEGVDQFITEEIKPKGLGAELFNEAQHHNGLVAARNLTIWNEVQKQGHKII